MDSKIESAKLPLEVVEALLDKDKILSSIIVSYTLGQPIAGVTITAENSRKVCGYINVNRPGLSNIQTSDIDLNFPKPLMLDLGSISLRVVNYSGEIYWILHFAPGGAKTKQDAMQQFSPLEVMRILISDILLVIEWCKDNNIPIPHKIISGETNVDMLKIVEKLSTEIIDYKGIAGYAGKVVCWDYPDLIKVMERYSRRSANQKST